jgi:hypothetical protein
MLNRYTLSAVAVLCLMVFGLLVQPGEADRILERLERLRTLAEIPAPESVIEQLTRAAEIGEFFSEQTVFDLRNASYGTTVIDSRDELVQRIIHTRARLAMLELALQDARVRIEDDTAEAVLTGSGLGQMTGEQERFLEIHTVAVSLRKHADEWLITGATHLRDERQPSAEQTD